MNGILSTAKLECQGKPSCQVRLPTYDEVIWNPEHDAGDTNCGFVEGDEYLSLVNVVAKCVGE